MRKMDEKDFDAQQQEILIDFVKNHPSLYIKQHKMYRKIQVRTRLRTEIGAKLNKSGK